MFGSVAGDLDGLVAALASLTTSPDAHTVEITTPTGHRYSSNAPPVLPEETDVGASPLERLLTLAA